MRLPVSRLLVSRLLIGLLVSGWLSIDLNSPRLWPRPRASSGSFFAPNSSTTTTRMKRVSGQPSMLRTIGSSLKHPITGSWPCNLQILSTAP